MGKDPMKDWLAKAGVKSVGTPEDFTKMHASERKRPTYTELLEEVKANIVAMKAATRLIEDYRAALKIARDILTDALENEGAELAHHISEEFDTSYYVGEKKFPPPALENEGKE